MAGLLRDERAWLRAAQSGSEADFEALFRFHWPRAYRAAYLIVSEHAKAEEIVEGAFIASVRALDGFGSHRPFGPWLHRIVVNRAVDTARARISRHAAPGESYLDVTAPIGWGGDGQAHPHLDPGARSVAVGLAQLPPEDRAVVVLRHVLEYGTKEIAEILDLPRSTVEEQLERGRARLEHATQEQA